MGSLVGLVGEIVGNAVGICVGSEVGRDGLRVGVIVGAVGVKVEGAAEVGFEVTVGMQHNVSEGEGHEF